MPAASGFTLAAVLLAVLVPRAIHARSIAAIRSHLCALLMGDHHHLPPVLDVRMAVGLPVRLCGAAIDETGFVLRMVHGGAEGRARTAKTLILGAVRGNNNEKEAKETEEAKETKETRGAEEGGTLGLFRLHKQNRQTFGA